MNIAFKARYKAGRVPRIPRFDKQPIEKILQPPKINYMQVINFCCDRGYMLRDHWERCKSITSEQFYSNSRERSLVLIRQVSAALMVDVLKHKWNQVGTLTGKHRTVFHHYKKAHSMSMMYPSYRKCYEKMKRELCTLYDIFI